MLTRNLSSNFETRTIILRDVMQSKNITLPNIPETYTLKAMFEHVSRRMSCYYEEIGMIKAVAKMIKRKKCLNGRY